MGITVSSDGYVHVGNNEWASLEAIQAAVLNAQHPTLTTNCPNCQQQNEELYDYAKSPTKKRQVANVEQEAALELPVLKFKKPESKKQTSNVSDESEFLPLPSTARR